MFENVPYNLDIINTGSTFAEYGFDYRYFIGKNGYNFAKSPQSLAQDQRNICEYLHHFQQSCVIVLSICPLAFCVDEYLNTISTRTFFAVKCLWYGAYKLRSMIKAEKTPEQSAMTRVKGWMNEFGLMNMTSQKPTETLQEIFSKTSVTLRKMLNLCVANGLRPIICCMPASNAETKLLSDSFKHDFFDINVKAANDINAPVFDYFKDSRFQDVALYVNGADCLNDAGRRRFASVIIKDLKSIKVW